MREPFPGGVRVKCPSCEKEVYPVISDEGSACPNCGASLAGPAGVETTQVGWERQAPAARSGSEPAAQAGAESPPAEPVLGLVVIYSETADAGDGAPNSRHGRLYPLRRGDVLLVGKPPASPEVLRSDGKAVSPVACHLFPFTPEFAHISRRHLTLEMEANGVTILTDYSTNGVTLLKVGRYARRPREETSQVHRLQGDETVVLGVDLAGQRDPVVLEQARRYQLMVLRPEGGAAKAKAAGVEATRT
jgi:hypothetical protein